MDVDRFCAALEWYGAEPDLPEGTGNSVSFVPSSGQAARVTLNLSTRLTNSPIYYSALLKLTDLSSVPTNDENNFICTFSDTTTSQTQGLSRAGARLVTKRSGAGYQLGIGLNSTEFAYATNVLNLGDVAFVAASWTYGAIGTNANLWVNPPASSFGASTPPAPSAGVTNGSTGGALNASGLSGPTRWITSASKNSQRVPACATSSRISTW